MANPVDECETPTFFIGLEVESVGVSHVALLEAQFIFSV
jgi:hypothetical protein